MDSPQIPLNLRSHNAMCAVGRLIRRWATAENWDVPGTIDMDGRRLTISRQAFLDLVVAEDVDLEDLQLRSDIEDIEIILPKPTTFTIILPEGELLGRQLKNAAEGMAFAKVPNLYLTSPTDMTGVPQLGATDGVHLILQLGTDAFEKFLDPHMAAYNCMQCA
jgi:hypothetical protein